MPISNVVKSIQNIMRKDDGVDGDAQRISQLCWMLFLRIYDTQEQEWEQIEENYINIIPKKFQWRDWAEDSEGITGDELLNFVNNHLFPEFKNWQLDETSDPRKFTVKNVFEDSYNYMKSGTLIRQVINKINEIDFVNQKERHLFNDIYEKILKNLQSAGNAGEFYTPRAVTQFIVDMINPQLGETILDPACGTGGFLVCTLENLKKQLSNINDVKQLQKSIKGIEIKSLPHMLAVTNMILHGFDVPDIKHDNSLAKKVTDYKAKEKVNIVITNPPFGGTIKDGIEMNFPSTLRTKETADLFLILIMHILKPGGRCGMVLPDGFLFGEGVKTRIKEKLLSEFNLHTIVRLPNGVFAPYTGINTNLLFFEKGIPTQEIWFFEHPLPDGYKNYTKTKPIRISEFKLEKEWWNNRKETECSWKVTIEEIKEKNYNLDSKNPSIIKEEKEYNSNELINKINEKLVFAKQLLEHIKSNI